MPWNDETIARLEKLWADGLTTVKIAEALGVSKNSVIGKVHRMKLPQRPSPIKSVPSDFDEIEENTKKPVKQAKETKKEKAPIAEKITKSTVKQISNAEGMENAERNISDQINKAVKIYKENVKLVELESNSCRWPSGDPKDEENFHFCGKKTPHGQTYCAEHNEIAYVKQLKR